MLVADDDPDVRGLMSLVLEDELGAEVIPARDGREARRLLRLCESLTESLRAGPCTNTSARSPVAIPKGREQICSRAPEARVPVLVVTDVNMPDVDGIELVRRLRECAAARSVPILVGHLPSGAPLW